MLFAAFAYSLNVFSQDYIPMNFEKGRWSVELDDKDGWDEKIQVYCKGDTLIEDLLYSKLYQNRLRRIPPGDYVDTIVGEYLGAIRNTENKKVILLTAHLDTIYDFNLFIGDTIKGSVDNIIINSIDSVEYCGRYHKRYADTILSQSVIEGVGYSNGLLGYFYPFIQNEVYRELVCYTEKDNPKCQACDFFVSNKFNIHNTVVYPIPANNFIMIRSSKPIKHFKLINFMGKEILFKEVNNQFTIEVEIEILCAGIYLIIIEFSDQTKTISQIVKS